MSMSTERRTSTKLSRAKKGTRRKDRRRVRRRRRLPKEQRKFESKWHPYQRRVNGLHQRSAPCQKARNGPLCQVDREIRSETITQRGVGKLATANSQMVNGMRMEVCNKKQPFSLCLLHLVEWQCCAQTVKKLRPSAASSRRFKGGASWHHQLTEHTHKKRSNQK